MKHQEIKKGEIVIYKTSKGPEISVTVEAESVWLTLNQLASLFDTDKSGVSRHIRNIYTSKELVKGATIAKIATVQKEGGRQIQRTIEYYNLDMILSIGYRVNSKRATQFRIWATTTLKNHLIKGYTVNEKRLLSTAEQFKELQNTIAFLEEKSKHELLRGQADEVLHLLARYAKTLTLLEAYDRDKLSLITKGKGTFVLSYEASAHIIPVLKKELIVKKEAGELFGQEYAGKLQGIIGNLYQTFGGKQLYPSLEEKAAHLLYFVIKDHPFADGNKRIGSFLFVYFLDKNDFLYKAAGEKKINDNALAALALLVAMSNPKEKDVIVKLITNLLAA